MTAGLKQPQEAEALSQLPQPFSRLNNILRPQQRLSGALKNSFFALTGSFFASCNHSANCCSGSTHATKKETKKQAVPSMFMAVGSGEPKVQFSGLSFPQKVLASGWCTVSCYCPQYPPNTNWTRNDMFQKIKQSSLLLQSFLKLISRVEVLYHQKLKCATGLNDLCSLLRPISVNTN